MEVHVNEICTSIVPSNLLHNFMEVRNFGYDISDNSMRFYAALPGNAKSRFFHAITEDQPRIESIKHHKA
jgi:hypothetical protein